MTAERKIAVVGGGIVGLCSALHLADAGFQVILVDPGDFRRAASFGNACQIAVGEVVPLSSPGVLFSVPKWLLDPRGPLSVRWRYLPRLTPWLIRFLCEARIDRTEHTSVVMATLCDLMWKDYEPLIHAAGAESLFVPSNYLRLYETEDQWRAEGFKWKLRERAGLEYETFANGKLHNLEPAVAKRFRFGVLLKGRKTVRNPERLITAFRALLESRGGRIVAGSVTGFDFRGNAASAIRLADGTRIEIDDVVIAAGAWSNRLTSLLGDRLPLESERGYHVMLPKPGIDIRRTVSLVAQGLVAVPIETGLRLAGLVEFAGLDAPPRPKLVQKLVDAARSVFPGLDVTDAQPWMGHRPSFPDSRPVIDRASQVTNVIYAFGHGHMGLSWAATTGRLVAALAYGRPDEIDMRPFRLSRFHN